MARHQVPLVSPKTIDEILTKEAKLTTTFKSLDNPPGIHYEGTIDGIEFLTDRTGSREEKALVVQKGLHAEALRYVSIIVENTLLLEIDDAESEQGDGEFRRRRTQIPWRWQVPRISEQGLREGRFFLSREAPTR
jgi:hypothetical protein